MIKACFLKAIMMIAIGELQGARARNLPLLPTQTNGLTNVLL